MPPPSCSPAARVRRLGAEGNKVYLPLAGRPLLSWALAAFAAGARRSRRLVLVARPADHALAQRRRGPVAARVEIVPGGATRHGSEWAALRHLAPAIRAGELDVVAIHDGARPLVAPELIEATVAAAREHGAAVPGVPLTERGRRPTCTAVDGHSRCRVQTPQAFRADLLLDAYERAERDGFTGTDTAACVERYAGVPGALHPRRPAQREGHLPRPDLAAGRAPAQRPSGPARPRSPARRSCVGPDRERVRRARHRDHRRPRAGTRVAARTPRCAATSTDARTACGNCTCTSVSRGTVRTIRPSRRPP